MDIKQAFKDYLVEQFRCIPPTEAAKDLRIRTLKELMNKAQDLRIKGIEEDELIYKMCIEGLGNFQQQLKEFTEQEHKIQNAKRKAALVGACSGAAVVVLVIIYIILGVMSDLWHPAWLLLLGGAFVGVIALCCYFGAKFAQAKKYSVMRLFPPIIIVLVCVFIFLILELIVHLDNAWFVFLVMVMAGFVFDTAVGYATNFKLRHVELAITVEICCVLLYVMLGLTLSNFWHPGWLLCLGGVVCALALIIALLVKRNKEKNKDEKAMLRKKYAKEDEAYYTMWDDE